MGSTGDWVLTSPWCHFCEKDFSTMSSLRRHLRRIHHMRDKELNYTKSRGIRDPVDLNWKLKMGRSALDVSPSREPPFVRIPEAIKFNKCFCKDCQYNKAPQGSTSLSHSDDTSPFRRCYIHTLNPEICSSYNVESPCSCSDVDRCSHNHGRHSDSSVASDNSSKPLIPLPSRILSSVSIPHNSQTVTTIFQDAFYPCW